MAISTTYLILQSQIVDELGGRTDLLSVLSGSGLTLSPVKNAIQSAIAKWEREPFYFNETYAATLFTTVNGQEFYTSSDAAAIATLANIYRLTVTISSVRYPLARRPWSYLEDVTPVAAGNPSDYAYLSSRIRLYPVPSGAFAVSAAYTARLSALSADGDTNAWTQDGFDLIRCEAKRILAQEVLHDSEMAQRMRLAIYGDPSDPRDTGYLGALREETARRGRFFTIRAEREDGPGTAMTAARGG